MPIDWASLLQSGLGAYALYQGLQNPASSDFNINFQDFATPSGQSATNFLQGQFESPSAFDVGGAFESYLPLIRRQEEELTDQLGNTFSRAFPANVGTQGPAVLATRRLGEEFLQNRNAFIQTLTLENQRRQLEAARTLAQEQGAIQRGGITQAIEGEQAQAQAEQQRNAQLAELGISLLSLGGIFGTGGGQSQSTSSLQRIFGQASSGAAGGGASSLPVGASLGNGLYHGGGGIVVNGSGQVVGSMTSNGTILSTSGQTLGTAAAVDYGLPGAGLLGPAGFGTTSGLLSSAGSAIGGGFVGYKVGTAVSDWWERGHAGETSNLGGFTRGWYSGMVGGGATGFATGGPVGAIIGAIVGAISGGWSGIYAERRREDAQRESEAQRTNAARPQAVQSAQQLFEAYTQSRSIWSPMYAKMTQGMQTLLSRGDAGMRQLLEQISQQIPEKRDDAFHFLPSRPNPSDPQAVMMAIKEGFDLVESYDPRQPHNPESHLGLLQSEETGKFGPGAQFLQASIDAFGQSSRYIQQLFSYLKNKGVI